MKLLRYPHYMSKDAYKKLNSKTEHLRKRSQVLAEIFTSTGLTRQSLARALGVERDALQRMIRAGAMLLEYLPEVIRLAKVEFESEVSDDGLRAVNFRISRHLRMAADLNAPLKAAKARTNLGSQEAILNLSGFTDLQLKRELQRRGWTVREPQMPIGSNGESSNDSE